MANTLTFSISSFASDRLTGTLVDGTTYSSPARNTLSVFVKGEKMKYDSTVDSVLTLTSDTSDPTTDASWTFTIPEDGWNRFQAAAIPAYGGGSTYALYDAAESGGVVYRSKQVANTGNAVGDTAWWEVIADPATLASNEGEANESANIDSTVYEPIVDPNSQYIFANQIAEASEQYLTSLELPDGVLDQYTLLGVLVDGLTVYSDRSQVSQGERLARKIDAIGENLE